MCCMFIPVDMTNVCTLCGESEKNESINGKQWVMSMYMHIE